MRRAKIKRIKNSKRTKNIYSELLDISDDLTDCVSLLDSHRRAILGMVNYHSSARSSSEPGDEELDQIEEEANGLLAAANKVIATLRGFKRLRPAIRQLASNQKPYFDIY
jgi:hypothetical protein